jgi:hypothetical protein
MLDSERFRSSTIVETHTTALLTVYFHAPAMLRSKAQEYRKADTEWSTTAPRAEQPLVAWSDQSCTANMFGVRVRPAALPHSSRLELFDRHLLRGALSKWKQFQIGHQHHYSVERALAFRDYCDRTSRTRVVVVCVLTLVPSFLVAILIECIPLRPPSEGWKANYEYWIRLFVSSVPSALGSNYIVKEGLDPGVVSYLRLCLAAVYSNVCNTALLLGFAAATAFPVPYGSVMTVVPYAVITTVFMMLAIGPCVIARSAKLRQQTLVQILAFGALGLMQVVYSSFGSIFNELSGYEQTLFVFVLPGLKFLVKQCVARAYRHLHECVGLTIVFSVDVCNVLYVVACMQTATSTLTTVAMIATDGFFIVLALQSIYSQANGAQRQAPPLVSRRLLGRVGTPGPESFSGDNSPTIPSRSRCSEVPTFPLAQKYCVHGRAGPGSASK